MLIIKKISIIAKMLLLSTTYQATKPPLKERNHSLGTKALQTQIFSQNTILKACSPSIIDNPKLIKQNQVR